MTERIRKKQRVYNAEMTFSYVKEEYDYHCSLIGKLVRVPSLSTLWNDKDETVHVARGKIFLLCDIYTPCESDERILELPPGDFNQIMTGWFEHDEHNSDPEPNNFIAKLLLGSTYYFAFIESSCERYKDEKEEREEEL